MQKFRDRPLVIAGPCAAESPELMHEIGSFMLTLSQELGFDYVFKASFDKANRSSSQSRRGPGLQTASTWFADLKKSLKVQILTDVHETQHVEAAALHCDYLQIPAFLCRQTDLVLAAAQSGRIVNIKKGQFMAPGAMAEIVQKARSVSQGNEILLTERGASFGYGNLVVDMRAFPIMAETGAPLLLDITHSTQLPAAGGEGGKVTGGQRLFAPTLARAATASGYLSGWFLEVHPNPAQAISDKDVQLNPAQAEALLRQLIPLWHQAKGYPQIDTIFR